MFANDTKGEVHEHTADVCVGDGAGRVDRHHRDHLRHAVARRPYRRLGSRQRHPGGWRIRDPLGRLGVGECVACRRRCVSVRADEARAVAPGRIDRCPRGGAAVDPYPCGVAHLGPARRAVAVDGASDLSGGRRDLPGCDGVGPAAGRVRATCRAGRYRDRGRGRVRRAQPSARRRRPPRGVVQHPGPRRSRRRARYRFRRGARRRSAAVRVAVHRGDLTASACAHPCHRGAAGSPHCTCCRCGS